MAGETTRSTLTEIVESEAIDTLILSYQYDEQVYTPFARQKSMLGEKSNVAAFPRWVKDAHTDISDEATSLSFTELETTEVTVSMARIGIAREVSEEALEDNVLGRSELFAEFIRDAARLHGEAADEDMGGHFGSAGNNVTDSGNDLEIIDLVTAMGLQRTARVRGPHVFLLHHIQLSDLQDAQAAATATPWATFYQPNADGSNFGGYFMGAPVFSSNLAPAANTNANRVGVLMAQGQAAPSYAGIGYAFKRIGRVETDKDILKDTKQLAVISRYGFGAIATNFYTKIVTDHE